MDAADEEMPELPPEVKINMKLDDIIKYQKMKAGVSHNLQFKQGHKTFRPYYKRRYRSQNWRLRGNGPNTPRWRHQKFQREGKVRAFLERKWKTAPSNSVFHRLGYNPLQESARIKVWRAKHYFRPQLPNFSFQKSYSRFNQRPTFDPNRAKKLIRSARIHSARLGDGLGDLTEECLPVRTLNEVNIGKLTEVLGGHITEVKEEKSDNGEVTTTIRRYDPGPNSIFDESSQDSTNSYAHNGAIQNGFNQANFVNPMSVYGYNMGVMNPYTMNAMHSMYGVSNMNAMNGGMNMNTMNGGMNMNTMNGGMNMNAMNGGMNMNAMNGGMNMNAMNGGMNMNSMNGMGNINGINSMYMPNQRPTQLFNNTRNSGISRNNFNGLNRMNQFNGSCRTNANSLSRIMNNSGLNQEQMIQKLNEPRESKPIMDSNGGSNRTWGRGIDATITCVATTKLPIHARFGGSMETKSLQMDE